VLGRYRLLLSLLVALSHAGVSVAGFNPGVCAVISFYLLSGHSITLLIRHSYVGRQGILPFYVDRILRMFPQFLLYSLLAAIVIFGLGVRSPYTIAFTPTKVFLNLLMLPQGYLFANTLEGAQLLPQSWALGLQLSFYLVVPWLMFWLPGPRLYLLGLASIGVFLLAYVGLVNTDAVGYRLLPGTFFMFLTGMTFADGRSWARRFRFGVLALSVVLYGGLLLDPRLYGLPFNREVLLGLGLGTVLIGAIRNTSSGTFDRACGSLAYGVFLNHVILIWILQHVTGEELPPARWLLPLMAASLLLAWLSYLALERPLNFWRRARRRRMAAAS
jgi:peptidoglycan/LPS O-acetylase OafA/YrhL